MSLIESIPTFDKSATLEEFRASFDAVKCVWFKRVDHESNHKRTTTNITQPGSCIQDSEVVNTDPTVEISVDGGGKVNRSSINGKNVGRGRTRRWQNPKKRKRKVSSSSGSTMMNKQKYERGGNKDQPSHHPNKSPRPPPTSKPLSFQKCLLHTIQSASPKDQASWGIENDDDGSLNPSTLTGTPSDFLSPTSRQNGYCSFVLQDDSNNAVSNFTTRHVRHPSLPLSAVTHAQRRRIAETVSPAQPYWLFLGRNDRKTALAGRNEHTDDIRHDGGTFHYQVVGRKTWRIRPTQELRGLCDQNDVALKDTYVCQVEEGDIFLINTRLWWHRTEIPGALDVSRTRNGAGTKHWKTAASNQYDYGNHLSISYARDLYLDGTQPTKGSGEDKMDMFSKDGSWATAFLAKGTVLFTEVDPPINRTTVRTDANCQLIVVKGKGDGDGDDDHDHGGKTGEKQRQPYLQLALITLQDIKEGEFFTLLESEDEGED